MGWQRDLPDPRDYTPMHDEVLACLRRLRRRRRRRLPEQVDLRRDAHGEYFSPPDDQGPLNSSCAHAALSLVEYFQRRGAGRSFEASKLFLYKVTRNRACKLRQVAGDVGAALRDTFKALVEFGVPPEEYCPYDVQRFDDEPGAFLYHLAKPFPALRYFRLDEPNRDGVHTLRAVKAFLAAGFPVAFGFPVPNSLTWDGNIPYRPDLDSIRGGQAVLAVGYNENHPGPSKRVLLVRNSWGTNWGAEGYGWLPSAYVEHQLAVDFWTLVNDDWLDPQEFFRPTLVDTINAPLQR